MILLLLLVASTANSGPCRLKKSTKIAAKNKRHIFYPVIYAVPKVVMWNLLHACCFLGKTIVEYTPDQVSENPHPDTETTRDENELAWLTTVLMNERCLHGPDSCPNAATTTTRLADRARSGRTPLEPIITISCLLYQYRCTLAQKQIDMCEYFGILLHSMAAC